ncbi:alpha/beta hydrolase family protein [Hoeflea sp.]|uniref:alpha/beta hydrolase family protein n=1 Tax=Hoeflea sp. TaxID=1940281 RepID=UPI00374963E6
MTLRTTFPALATTLAASFALTMTATAAELVGTRDITVFSVERQMNLPVTIWYPASHGPQATVLDESRVFEGTPASVDAEPEKGQHPLVVFSHGSGSSIQSMGWLAAHLAKAGFIVAGPNHPHTTSGDSTPADTPLIWQRVDDLSSIITALSASQDWGGIVDNERIGVLGFSLGGAAAMKISGARASLEGYADYCETWPDMPDCRWFAGGIAYADWEMVEVDPLDLRTIDKGLFERQNRDPRIKSAVLVDPSVAQAFNTESLRQIDIPMAFINLGSPESIIAGVDSHELAALTPHGSLSHIDQAIHFSFLPECRRGAEAFLKQVGEVDPICDDGGSRSRADIHAELKQMIATLFTSTLMSTQ